MWDKSIKKGLTKEEVFEEIFKGVYVKDVLHLKFFMKVYKEEDGPLFLADFNNEDNTMYFSPLKVWGEFEEMFEMSYEEIRLFLYEQIKQKYGFILQPYKRGEFNFG